MMLDNDLKDILYDMADWRKAYNCKCNEIKELTSLTDVLKNELRISRDNEKRISSHLNKKQEHITQLQEILSTFSEQQEGEIEDKGTLADKSKRYFSNNGQHMKVQDDYEKLKMEMEKTEKKHTEDRQIWNQERLDLVEKYENELKLIKDAANKEAYLLKIEINKLTESNVKRLDCIQNEMKMKEEDYKRSISRTISTYEEELSKLNGDLAKAQTEIQVLRERCAASVNIYRDLNTARYEPMPIVTAQSQIFIETNETMNPPQSNETYYMEQQLQQTKRKPKLSVIRKRKLYTPADDII